MASSSSADRRAHPATAAADAALQRPASTEQEAPTSADEVPGVRASPLPVSTQRACLACVLPAAILRILSALSRRTIRRVSSSVPLRLAAAVIPSLPLLRRLCMQGDQDATGSLEVLPPILASFSTFVQLSLLNGPSMMRSAFETRLWLFLTSAAAAAAAVLALPGAPASQTGGNAASKGAAGDHAILQELQSATEARQKRHEESGNCGDSHASEAWSLSQSWQRVTSPASLAASTNSSRPVSAKTDDEAEAEADAAPGLEELAAAADSGSAAAPAEAEVFPDAHIVEQEVPSSADTVGQPISGDAKVEGLAGEVHPIEQEADHLPPVSTPTPRSLSKASSISSGAAVQDVTIDRVLIPAAGIEQIGEKTVFKLELYAAGAAAPFGSVRRRYQQCFDLAESMGPEARRFAPFPRKYLRHCVGERLEQRRRELENWINEALSQARGHAAVGSPGSPKSWSSLLQEFLTSDALCRSVSHRDSITSSTMEPTLSNSPPKRRESAAE
eukprot:TRINITY_DN38451_c0_g1_i1.p1 TRINITY_DN38451_c0_g1~~TRINITY_DN38451_c0_g1_i1.p1  ORF type:complete len:503 (-),score=104.50 TRINITY_DN38451_c0_g1_i1:84-1592(-)